jgi:hypothetical protein
LGPLSILPKVDVAASAARHDSILAKLRSCELYRSPEKASGASRKRVDPSMDPYQDMWRELSPAARLRRSWRLRSRVKNLQAVHDAKSLPKL